MNVLQILLLIGVIIIAKDLEKFEREEPILFTALFVTGAVLFTGLADKSLKSSTCPQGGSGICIERVSNFRAGSDQNSDRKRFIVQIVDGKTRKFDLVFHSQLEQHFPDWKERMEYQRNQEKLYDSAMKKRRQALRLRLQENWNRTDEEQDAIDYFNGTGFYKEHQKLSRKPNVFDNRQSFLFKMHNKEMRNDFLNSFNRANTY